MKVAKPFLKWAGGKTQLISTIEQLLPKDVVSAPFTYIEPFVGSGAVFFWMIQNFPAIERVIINDINVDLINTYKVIATQPHELIAILDDLQNEFYALENYPDKKKEYYYQKREQYNTRDSDTNTQAALFIFLNRTCFNGLYRVNRKNEYNVPIGRYSKPTISDPPNLWAVHRVLQNVEILCGSYEQTLSYSSTPSFFYLDPPYKPISATSSFTSYAKDKFNDTEQIRLRDFCERLESMGHRWLLSNSDAQENNADNKFFDKLYSDFVIERVRAKRSINANPEKRGIINELLIMNYNYEQTVQTH